MLGDAEGTNVLIHAVQKSNVDCLKALLEMNADPNLTDALNKTPLIWAIKRQHFDFVELLVQFGAKINSVKSGGPFTALVFAAMHGNTRILRFLLDHGADVHARTTDGSTALLFAARYEKTSCYKTPSGIRG